MSTQGFLVLLQTPVREFDDIRNVFILDIFLTENRYSLWTKEEAQTKFSAAIHKTKGPSGVL